MLVFVIDIVVICVVIYIDDDVYDDEDLVLLVFSFEGI